MKSAGAPAHPPSASRGQPLPARCNPLWHFVFVIVCLCASSSLGAQDAKPEEYQVKAAYLFNFGKFIEWPTATTPNESFSICVVGQDPFGKILDSTVAGEEINKQKLVARRITKTLHAAECRILFVSNSEAGRIKEILAPLASSAVLTVSDMPGFSNEGGMIQFVLKDNKIRFEVNLAAAQKAGLSFSSQLLKVAVRVKTGPHSDRVNP